MRSFEWTVIFDGIAQIGLGAVPAHGSCISCLSPGMKKNQPSCFRRQPLRYRDFTTMRLEKLRTLTNALHPNQALNAPINAIIGRKPNCRHVPTFGPSVPSISYHVNPSLLPIPFFVITVTVGALLKIADAVTTTNVSTCRAQFTVTHKIGLKAKATHGVSWLDFVHSSPSSAGSLGEIAIRYFLANCSRLMRSRSSDSKSSNSSRNSRSVV